MLASTRSFTGEELEERKGELPQERGSKGHQAGEGWCFSSDKAHASMGKLLWGIFGLGKQQKSCTELAVLERPLPSDQAGCWGGWSTPSTALCTPKGVSPTSWATLCALLPTVGCLLCTPHARATPWACKEHPKAGQEWRQPHSKPPFCTTPCQPGPAQTLGGPPTPSVCQGTRGEVCWCHSRVTLHGCWLSRPLGAPGVQRNTVLLQNEAAAEGGHGGDEAEMTGAPRL